MHTPSWTMWCTPPPGPRGARPLLDHMVHAPPGLRGAYPIWCVIYPLLDHAVHAPSWTTWCIPPPGPRGTRPLDLLDHMVHAPHGVLCTPSWTTWCIHSVLYNPSWTTRCITPLGSCVVSNYQFNIDNLDLPLPITCPYPPHPPLPFCLKSVPTRTAGGLLFTAHQS